MLPSTSPASEPFPVKHVAAVEPLRVRVREGSVELREDGQLAGARAGEELGLASDGTIRRGSIAIY